jgi:hypothetical protein
MASKVLLDYQDRVFNDVCPIVCYTQRAKDFYNRGNKEIGSHYIDKVIDAVKKLETDVNTLQNRTFGNKTGIIIHHSRTKESKETMSWSAIRRYHIEHNGWDDIGYHFGIEWINHSLEVLVGRELHEDGAHCKGHNDQIGIMLTGNFDIMRPDPKMIRRLVKTCASLCMVLNIPASDIKGHGEITGDRTCPGKMFDMNALRIEVYRVTHK